MSKETEIQSIALKAKQYELCLEEDSFLEDKPIWICVLSNGLSVYQDDDRKGVSEPCAWKRLGKYIRENNLDIVGIYIKFRSHTEEVNIPEEKEKAKGIYFSYAIIKSFDDAIDRRYYTFGFCDGQQLKYEWFLVPEILKTDETCRNLERDDIEDGRVILNSRCDKTFISWL